jgi:hypothetical protein
MLKNIIYFLRINKPVFRTKNLFENVLETIFMNKPGYRFKIIENYFTIGYIQDLSSNKRF